MRGEEGSSVGPDRCEGEHSPQETLGRQARALHLEWRLCKLRSEGLEVRVPARPPHTHVIEKSSDRN